MFIAEVLLSTKNFYHLAFLSFKLNGVQRKEVYVRSFCAERLIIKITYTRIHAFRVQGERKSNKASGVCGPSSNWMLIAIDIITLPFLAASQMNGVSIHITRSFHSHVVSNKCYVRFAFTHTTAYCKQCASIALPVSPSFPSTLTVYLCIYASAQCRS